MICHIIQTQPHPLFTSWNLIILILNLIFFILTYLLASNNQLPSIQLYYHYLYIFKQSRYDAYKSNFS